MSKGTPSEAGQVDTGAGTGEVTGRYAIDAERRAATVVPPTTPEAEELSLDALDAMIEAAPAGAKPVTLPPPVPAHARSHASGLAPARSRAPVAAVEPEPAAEDEGVMDSLRPFYKELEGSTRERAEVDIADLSLQPDNPYVASSLVPPAEKPPATGRIVVGIAALIAFAAGGYFAFVRAPAAPVEPPSAMAPAPSIEPATESAATPVEPAPVAVAEVAPPAEEQPAAVEPPAEAKVEAAPVVVETSPAPAPAAAPVQVATAPAGTVGSATGPAPASVPTAAQPALAAVDAKPAGPAAVVTGEPLPPAAAAPGVAAPATAPAASDPAASTAAAGTAPSAAPASLPEAPTREEVAAGFDALRPDLLQCAAGKTGVVVIDATLANTGRVAYALVDGAAFKGTPEGSCMARAIRKARFPLFAQATLKVRYPVQL